MNDSLSNHEQRLNKKKFFYILAIVGIAIFLAYALTNLYVKDYADAGLEFLLVGLLVTAVIAINFEKGWYLALFLGSLTVTIISIHNYITGGFEATGLFWVYMFPPIIFMIQGAKKGFYWSIAFLTMLLSVLVLYIFNINLPKYFDSPYSVYTLTIFLVSLSVILVLIYIFQNNQEKSQVLLNKQIEQNKKNNMDLEESLQVRDESLQARDKSLKETKKQSQELEKMNKLMIGRELKIIELKEEINEFKKQLEQKNK